MIRQTSAKRRWIFPVLCAALSVIALRAADRTADRFHPPPLDWPTGLSTEVLDKDGRLLRPFANTKGRWRLALDMAELDPRFTDLLVAYEDRRFWRHSGVDLLAMARAGLLWIVHGRIVSGGSTLTMQLARLLEPRPRTLTAKLHQMWRAVQIERRLTKRQILARYLTLAPYGGNLEGLRAAALAYFGHGVGHLPPAKAALLVALPQSPEARRPDRNPRRARKARDRVLDRVELAGVLASAEAEAARRRPSITSRRAFPAHAAHEADRLARNAAKGSRISTHIDRDLQAQLEGLALGHVRALGPRVSAAIIVAEHGSGKVRSIIGAPAPSDASRLGSIDMTRAVRSPGSALKPFIYRLAFEAGLAHPETLIDDRPTDFSGYAPRNFNNRFQGTVTLAEALSQSLNIPAVKLLEAVGPARLIAALKNAGIDPRLPEGKPPGLAVALGGVGVKLREIAGAYAALARGGEAVVLRTHGRAQNSQNPDPGSGEIPAWYVTDILTRTPPPEAAPGGRIAYKTGTSYGYRDAWAIGYDGAHVIAVWTGRPDGTPVPGISGISTAAPLLFAAFSRLKGGITPLARPPDGVLAGGTSDLPLPMRRFGSADILAQTGGPNTHQTIPLSIAFPPQGAHIETIDIKREISLKAAGGTLPLTWFANGKPVIVASRRRQTFWQPDGLGFSDLSVIDAAGQSAKVRVFLE